MLEPIENPHVVRGVTNSISRISPCREKFWTGRMIGRFPEYLKDSSRACRVTEDRAKHMAAECNGLTPASHWEAIPAKP